MLNRPSLSVVVASLSADSDATVAAQTGLRYCGFSAKETSGTTAVLFNIVHGATGAAGTVLDYVRLAPGETTRDWYGTEGRSADSGLSIDWISGAASVVLHYKVLA